jgi:hypothetical protein
MSQVPIRLETQRLVLRGFQDSDIAAFLSYRSASQMAKYQSCDTPYSEVKAFKFIQLILKV